MVVLLGGMTVGKLTMMTMRSVMTVRRKRQAVHKLVEGLVPVEASSSLKPFPMGTNLTCTQSLYNYHLSRSCIVAENAFGRLKVKWWRICGINDMHIDHVPCVVTACCILHIICEACNECFNEPWLEQAQLNTQQQPPRPPFVGNVGRRTTAIRNAPVRYFAWLTLLVIVVYLK